MRLLPLPRRDAKMASSMPDRYHDNDFRPRVGVPWRLAREEAANNRPKIEKYLRAVENAGGEPVLVSLLSSSEELKRQAAKLDAFLLTGIPADVTPAHFHATRHSATVVDDFARGRPALTLFVHALLTG